MFFDKREVGCFFSLEHMQVFMWYGEDGVFIIWESFTLTFGLEMWQRLNNRLSISSVVKIVEIEFQPSKSPYLQFACGLGQCRNRLEDFLISSNREVGSM